MSKMLIYTGRFYIVQSSEKDKKSQQPPFMHAIDRLPIFNLSFETDA